MDDDSPVERLNETLYSRTSYHSPEDTRTPLGPVEDDAARRWQTPDLDDMLKDRRNPNQPPTKMKNFFVFSLLVFVGAFAIAAYVYLAGGNFISTKNVDIQITGPSAVNAGDTLVLTVTVQNKNNAALGLGSLSVQYPAGTRDASDPTQALTRDHADLGTIQAGGETTQTFRSVLFGQKGDVKEIKLTLQYKVSGSAATFYKDKTFDVSIGDTPVALGVSKPDSVNSGQTFTTRIQVASNSSDVVQNVVVEAQYPYGFKAVSSDPAPSDADNVWVLGDLAPGAKKTIVVTGSIVGVDQEERTFRFYAGVADAGTPTQMKSPLISTTETLAIARPTLQLTLALNGDASGQDYVAPAGQPVAAALQYVNNAPDKLTNAAIVVKLTGAVDPSSIQPVGGFYDSNSNTITWRAADTPELASLDPGAQGSVSFSFRSIPNPGPGSQTIAVSTSMTGTSPSSADPVTASDQGTVKIASQITMSGKTLYSRGPFKNTGPVPPKAGATTTYTAVIDLGNTQNDISDGVVTAKLGPNVSWLNAPTGAEPVTYDAQSNMVTWKVGTLASGSGFSKPAREIAFQVALLPSIGQIGTAPNLVSNIAFSGTDSFVKAPVSAKMPNLTTRLDEASYTQGDETVTK